MRPEKNSVFRLEGKVQHYAWGGYSFIPRLLGISNPGNEPFAEYWLGAHNQASSSLLLLDKEPLNLNEYIQSFPEKTLGGRVARRFGRLPYLLKILDVRDMLSIQVHPSKKNAELEFEEENRRAVSFDAIERNYKDDNHKPELMVALTECWLLHGFKPRTALQKTLLQTRELQFLLPVFENGGYQALFQTAMTMEQEKVNHILGPLLDRILPLYQDKRLDKTEADFWACRAAEIFNRKDFIDRGIFSIYFFNLVRVLPGKSVFQDAGLPHAYLQGQMVELMANSDNVLRGGLTPKHIDVHELMKHVRFKETFPELNEEKKISRQVGVFKTSAPDFELTRITLAKEESLSIRSYSTEICIVLEGSAVLREVGQKEFFCNTGHAWVSFDEGEYEILAAEKTVLFRASVPGDEQPER
jgi:mannose-6-phosphate isomerase